MIAGRCSNLEEIVERESELVEKIAEVECYIIQLHTIKTPILEMDI